MPTLSPFVQGKGEKWPDCEIGGKRRQLTYGLRSNNANGPQSEECEGGEAIGNHGEGEGDGEDVSWNERGLGS